MGVQTGLETMGGTMPRNKDIQCVWKGMKPTQEEIQEILDDHKVWLASFSDRTNEPPHDLRGIRLGKANLSFADLSGANLSEADLSGAFLDSANLSGAFLNQTDMRGASLIEAHLSKTKLRKANLSGAILIFADLSEAELRGANFSNADLNRAVLNRAMLYESTLSGADLSWADLSWADMRKVNLGGATLVGANFHEAQVTDVIYKNLNSCRGVRAESCYGDALFRRHVMDEDYIETFRERHNRIWKIWYYTSDCGRSLIQWALCSLNIALVFALFFWLVFDENSIKVPKSLGFTPVTMAYYSIVTFTTLGFGDITPQTTGASIAVTIEVIIGYIMLGGLISIFANKLARRA